MKRTQFLWKSRSLVSTLAPCLNEGIEQAWGDEVLPDDWGSGILLAVLKKGDKTKCGNYGGISRIKFAAKVFAVLLLRRFRAVQSPPKPGSELDMDARTKYSHYGTFWNFVQQQKLASIKSAARPSGTASKTVNCSNIFDVSSGGSDWRSYKPAVFGLGGSSCSRRRGNALVSAYLLLKVLYLLNSVGQIFLMQAFLGLPDAFGLLALRNILDGHDWQVTLVFPRVGFCYTPVRNLGSKSNAITAQCTLPVNMLNEKIFIFLWWWILLAVMINTLSLLIWLGRLCCRSVEAAYVVKYLSLADELEPYDERDAENFATLFLRRDGMFLLRMIRINAGDVVAAAVVSCLWNRYMTRVRNAMHDPLSNVRLQATRAGPDKACGSGDDDDDGEDMKEHLYPVAGKTAEPNSATPSEKMKPHLENFV
nr:unnamed protein product [Spirometra erinaceieuropaei]